MRGTGVFSDPVKTAEHYRMDASALGAIQSFQKEANERIGSFLADFYDWLPTVDEYKRLFSSDATLTRVKGLQQTYWQQFFEGRIDEGYIQSRYKVGMTHAKIDLPIASYCSAVSFGMSWWANRINESTMAGTDKVKLIDSMNKLIMLDTAITSAAFAESVNKVIEEQSRTLLELSTPTIQLWDGVLVLPIVGVLDSARAKDMSDELLRKISTTAASVAILDIVGVPNVDSAVAGHLIKIVKATKLLGCNCIVSGISPEIAQTLVQLGLNLDDIDTTSNLQNAFRRGLDRVGLSIHEKK